MKTYEVVLSPKTKIMKLHSSQQIFGFLCYQVLDNYNKAILENMLEDINNGKKILKISSIMPETSVFWPSFEVLYSSQDYFDSVIAKQIKQIKYVSEKVLKDLVKAKYKGDLLVSYIKENKYQIDKDLLMYKDELVYDYDLSIDIRFSSKEKTIYNIKSYRIDRSSKFRFFIETDIDKIVNVINNNLILSFGKNKNTGLNIYEMDEIKEISLNQSETNILLSKYIPKNISEEIDIDMSLCKIELVHSKVENRMFDIYDPELIDSFSAIQEGSIIKKRQNYIGQLKVRDYASKVLNHNVYYNGIAFLYPLEV